MKPRVQKKKEGEELSFVNQSDILLVVVEEQEKLFLGRRRREEKSVKTRVSVLFSLTKRRNVSTCGVLAVTGITAIFMCYPVRDRIMKILEKKTN